VIEALRGEGKDETPPAPESIGSFDVADERAIRCATCGHPITTAAAKISVHGAHEHRRVNPAGVDFHLGCFRDAPGCAVEGVATTFWTWFPGYAWRPASCAGCLSHLGWAFGGEGSAFFGLILPRLIEDH
jgi:hypothetical protein